MSVRVDEECVSTSLQCGRQIAQLKDEYEESKKTLEEALKQKQVSTHIVLTNKMVKRCVHCSLVHFLLLNGMHLLGS